MWKVVKLGLVGAVALSFATPAVADSNSSAASKSSDDLVSSVLEETGNDAAAATSILQGLLYQFGSVSCAQRSAHCLSYINIVIAALGILATYEAESVDGEIPQEEEPSYQEEEPSYQEEIVQEEQPSDSEDIYNDDNEDPYI